MPLVLLLYFNKNITKFQPMVNIMVHKIQRFLVPFLLKSFRILYIVDLEILNFLQVLNTFFFLISISLYSNSFSKNVSLCPNLRSLMVDNGSSSKLGNNRSFIYTRIINTIFVFINMKFAELLSKFWDRY